MVNKTIKVIKEKKNKNTTDAHLQVKSYGGYEMQDWNGQEVVEALTKECGLKTVDATKIAEDVYNDIIKIGKHEIEVATLKNMINYHLLMNGHNGVKLQGQMNVGMSVYDLDNLIKNKSSENSNVGNNNPEAVALCITENSLKKYALNKVFSKDVSEAHLMGKIHAHDLGQITKSYCHAASLRAIAKYGLGQYIHFESVSKPAKTAQTLIGHLNTFMCSIASYFAGAIGIDYVNIHMAPYVEGMSFKEMKQVAQYMIFSLSQSAFSRGGQTLFSDLNLHISIPDWLGKVKAIGPGGVELERTLSTYESTARQFLMAMLEVYEEGDANGMPFFFPKCFDKETQMLVKHNNKKHYMTISDLYDVNFNEYKVPRFNQETKEIEWVFINGMYKKEKEKGIEIKLTNGIRLKTTNEHKYYCWEEGKIVVKLAKDLKLDDILLYKNIHSIEENNLIELNTYNLLKDEEGIQVHNLNSLPENNSRHANKNNWADISLIDESAIRDDSYFSSYKQKTHILKNKIVVDEIFAKILGYFVAEGSITNNNRINIAAKKGLRAYDDIDNLLKNCCLFDSYGKDNDGFYIYGVLLTKIFRKLFNKYNNHASEKTIPNCILNSNESVIRNFIAGAFNGDGCKKSFGVSYATASIELATEMKWLLNSIDISGTIYSGTAKGYEGRNYYTVSIVDKYENKKFFDKIGQLIGWENHLQLASNKSVSWFNSYPVKCLSNDSKICNYDRNSRKTVSCENENYKLDSSLEGLHPVLIKEIKETDVEAISLSVEHENHDFITGTGILTKNCDLHITSREFEEQEAMDVLRRACQVASKNGGVYFVFDKSSTALSACCFTGNQQVLIKSGEGGKVRLISFEEIDKLHHTEKTNFTVFHNGSWNRAKFLKLSGKDKKMYKITTTNKKEQVVTEDHIVPTLNGDKQAKDITIDDYLLFNTLPLNDFAKKDKHSLTYEQGVIIGVYLGDGSISQKKENHKAYINFSLNEKDYAEIFPYISKGLKDCGIEANIVLSTIQHNVYPMLIGSTELKDFIKQWTSGGYSYEKELNLDCLRESKEFRQGIVDGMYMSDGGNSNRIYSISKKLIDQMECVFTSLGMQTVIDCFDRREEESYIRGEKINHNYLIYSIRWFNLKTRRIYPDHYIIKNNSIYYKVSSVEEKTEEEYVYCFEMDEKYEPYFTLPSGIITHNCRLRTELDDLSVLLEPERIRFSGIQNVTINLPQCAYRSGKDEKKFFKEVKDMMDLVVKAHLQKKKYLEIIGSEHGTPMYEIVGKTYFDGEPYINLNKGTYIIGFIGINEVVKHLYGKELHEDKAIHTKGKMIIAYMYNLLGKYKKEHGLKFSLEESPAESTSRRLAKCDWERFEESHNLVKGNKESGDLYYTNSCHYAANAPIDFLERHIGQAEFHNMIESGAITHMFCGEKTPSAESIFKLLEVTFKTTNCAQLTISPEFTVCHDCQQTIMGLHKICPKCGGSHTEGITRIVGYYSRIDNWNDSKIEELEDRHKGQYQIS